MTREWKPGDVAMAEYSNPRLGGIGLWVDGCIEQHQRGPHWHFANGGHGDGSEAESVRPLVVIDPEDREQTVRLMDALIAQCSNPQVQVYLRKLLYADVEAALRDLANPTPPRPEEPTGLGAVVEDAEGVRWTRVKDGFAWRWRDDRFGEQTTWPHIDVVRELSPGWSA